MSDFVYYTPEQLDKQVQDAADKVAKKVFIRIKRNNNCMDQEYSLYEIKQDCDRTTKALEDDPTLWRYVYYVTIEKLRGSDNYYYKNVSYRAFYDFLLNLSVNIDMWCKESPDKLLTCENGYNRWFESQLEFIHFENMLKEFDIDFISYKILD